MIQWNSWENFLQDSIFFIKIRHFFVIIIFQYFLIIFGWFCPPEGSWGRSSSAKADEQLLKEKDMNAGEIAERFNISKPSISHHLDILRQADLVTSEKKGQFVEYSLNTTILEDLLNWILTLKK